MGGGYLNVTPQIHSMKYTSVEDLCNLEGGIGVCQNINWLSDINNVTPNAPSGSTEKKGKS